MCGLVCLLPSCVDNKVGEYPLPRHGGIMAGGASSAIASDIRSTDTIGSGIGDPAVGGNVGDIPVLPGVGQQPAVTPPVADPALVGQPKPAGTTGAAQGSKKYPYAIPVPGEPDYVYSPYDNRKVCIRQADGRLISSGKVIRAQGETDPSKKFIIP